MKTGILLSVRNKATRFPGKVLKPFGSTTVTGFLIRRLKESSNTNIVVLATSDDSRDDVLEGIAQSEDTFIFRGSREDKLRRYRDAANHFELDFVVIVDGDDPFVSVDHIDQIITCATKNVVDFVYYKNLPLGATGFGLRQAALISICEDRAESDTEVWGSMFLDDPRFNCAELVETNDALSRPDIRMTLDYPEDYRFFTTVLDGLSKEGKDSSFLSIMEYLARKPDVIKINSLVEQQYH